MHESQMTKLNVPAKLAVGFNNRTDTYSGKLAYITYFRKDAIAKETSWQNWRDKNIEPVYTDNIPTEGFVLNKHVGGCKSWWNFRQSYCRIWDPRGFEFEITIPNLLYILETCNCLKGKGLEGKFVYSWDGQDLVLLPVDTEEYRQSVALQQATVEIKNKDGEVGYAYRSKDDKNLYYLGKLYVPKFVNGTARTVRHGWYRDDVTYNRVVTYERLHCFVTEDKSEVYWYPDFKKFYYRTDERLTPLEVNDVIDSLKAVSIYTDKPGEHKPVKIALEALSEEEMDLWNRFVVNHEKPRTPEEVFAAIRLCGSDVRVRHLHKSGDEYCVVNDSLSLIVNGQVVHFSDYNDFIDCYANKPNRFYKDEHVYTKEELDELLLKCEVKHEANYHDHYVLDQDGVAHKYYGREDGSKMTPTDSNLVYMGKEPGYRGPYVVLDDGGWIDYENVDNFTKTGGHMRIRINKQ